MIRASRLSLALCTAAPVLFAVNTAPAFAATIVEEGFSSRFEVDKDGVATPLNRVSRISAGEDLAYWVQWKDYPAGTAPWRCVTRFEAGDDSAEFEGDEDGVHSVAATTPDGFSMCAVSTDIDITPNGKYTFTGYLGDKKVAENSIEIRTRFIDHFRRVSWKTWAMLLGLAALALIALDRRRKRKAQA